MGPSHAPEDDASDKVPTTFLPVLGGVQKGSGPPKTRPGLVRTAALCGVAGALLVAILGGAVRGCRASGRIDDLRATRRSRRDRPRHVGGGDVCTSAADTPPSNIQTDAAAMVATVEASPECAVAKIAAYNAWQDAFARAKVLAAPAQAVCAGKWGDEKKQICYHAASAGIRAAQAARDSVVGGGSTARDAVKSVKDDAKNEAIAPARAASERAFAACREEGASGEWLHCVT